VDSFESLKSEMDKTGFDVWIAKDNYGGDVTMFDVKPLLADNGVFIESSQDENNIGYRIENLEWVTRSENTIHAIKI